MHARHRSPVTAYNRSNSIGMGGVGRVAASSRISPEGSMRGHEMYNSEYKSYNRDGLGRGQSKHFPLRQPSPQRSDVFMEAGRMAAEYLVRKGLLPQSVLSGKLQNGNVRNPLGYNSGFRAQEGDDMQVSVGSRTSALSRLGNHAADVVPGRRRYPDEYSAIGPKSYIRGRRRNGSSKDSEWNRDLGRSGSWSDRSRASQDVDNQPDHFSGHQDEKKFTKDSYSELQKSPPMETDSDGNLVRDSELALGKYSSVSNAATKAGATSTGKDLLPEDEVGPIQMSAKMETSTGKAGEAKDDNSNDDMEQKSTEDDSHVQLRAEEVTQTCKKGTDLLSLCRFEKVPTKTRSSLTARSSKVVRNAMVEEKDTNETGHPTELESHAEDMPSDPSLHQNHDIKPLGSDNSSVPEEGQIVAHAAEENITRSLSFTDDAEMEGGVKNEELTIFGNCSTAEIGQKRALDDDNGHKQNKKPREFTSSDDTQSDFFMYHSGLKEKQQNLHEPETANGKRAVLSPEHKRLVDVSLFPNGDVMQSAEFEEKQLFPSSFKTCDLNLMEASDMNDNHDADTDLIYPSITGSGKQSASIDIDLSINSNCNLMDKYNKCGFDGKDIEVIDLENDSEQDSKAFNNQLGSSVTGFTGREGFPNNAHNVNEIADVQDGYGLMISELLGNDMPNCSSVPGDMNALHNDMGLHNGEGILGDDDSIYMSLGEIPISFLRGWEQPSQEFGKPF